LVGNAKVKLSVVADQCTPFDIYWVKTCKDKSRNVYLINLGKLPSALNIGISSKANEIVENGAAKDVVRFLNPNNEEKFLIPQDVPTFSLFLSTQNPNVILYLT
jgi:hypothetical protein